MVPARRPVFLCRLLGVNDDEPIRWQIDPENIQAATTALARLLRLLGAQEKEPDALFGLCALVGATLLRYTEFTSGQMLDLMQEYAADDQLVEAIGVVLRSEGILGVNEPLPTEDASGKPN